MGPLPCPLLNPILTPLSHPQQSNLLQHLHPQQLPTIPAIPPTPTPSYSYCPSISLPLSPPPVRPEHPQSQIARKISFFLVPSPSILPDRRGILYLSCPEFGYDLPHHHDHMCAFLQSATSSLSNNIPIITFPQPLISAATQVPPLPQRPQYPVTMLPS